ncbi:hypothetical protein CHS0354_032398 [Potamilus streckersoni]|uniref:Uncharacterized protein n=1 Tax=Potamilus streckersoni TaxID=2493646 RepID=A0AAE0TGN9_9BIVA|nr:hypothetical protein CHS0354_032398 [Potamilus streckersoni]
MMFIISTMMFVTEGIWVTPPSPPVHGKCDRQRQERTDLWSNGRRKTEIVATKSTLIPRVSILITDITEKSSGEEINFQTMK